jgi:ribonuclease P protein component
MQTGSEAPLRVGYTATKKIGNAVARNRARRRLKEAARLTLAEAAPLNGVELVLICRQETARLPFTTLCANLKTALADATTARGDGLAAARQKTMPMNGHEK